MTLRYALPLVLVLALATVPAAVPAPPSPFTLALGTGDNWSAVVFSAPADCTSAKLHATWNGGQKAAFALVYLFGGTGVLNYAAYWEEGNNVWLHVESGAGSFGVGPRHASTPPGYSLSSLYGANGLDLSSALCSGSWTYTRAALVVPGASSARVEFVFTNAPAVTATMGGANAFANFGSDFAPVGLAGTRVDVGAFGPGNGYNPAANAAFAVSATETLPAGMLGVFLAQKIEYAGLRVDGPTATLADADCVSLFLTATCLSYGYVGGLGFGNATRAPAGDYDFLIRYQAGAEHHRVAAVGAPVDWCAVGPRCPNIGY